MKVPLNDLAAQQADVKDAIVAAIARLATDAKFILGAPVEELERWLAQACGTTHAVGGASGTDALELALRALGIGGGDAVVTPAFSFIAAAEAIAAAGARPVFCDVEDETLCASARTFEAATARAKKAMSCSRMRVVCTLKGESGWCGSLWAESAPMSLRLGAK